MRRHQVLHGLAVLADVSEPVLILHASHDAVHEDAGWCFLHSVQDQGDVVVRTEFEFSCERVPSLRFPAVHVVDIDAHLQQGRAGFKEHRA